MLTDTFRTAFRPQFVAKHRLLDCASALRLTHFPPPDQSLDQLCELPHSGAGALDLRRILQRRRRAGAETPQGERGARDRVSQKDSARQAIKKVLPFHPTAAQKRVLKRNCGRHVLARIP